MAGYYYGQLSKEKKAVYDMLAAGCDALAAVIRVPDLGTEVLSDIYLRMKLDLPLLFFVTGFHYRKMPGADHVEVLPDYLFDRGKVKMHRQAVTARLERLARPLKGKSDREKELAIHDFILENVTYDKLKKSYSHEIIGPLTQGVGVCEGIAKTVKVLCDAVGLPCIVALSEAAPEIGVRYRHTWNVVTVEGQRYHVDATFDNSLQRGMKRYDYFNLDDRHIFRDHQKLVLPLPECGGDKGYFYRSLSFTKTEDVEKRVRQALRKKPRAWRRPESGDPGAAAGEVRRCGGGAGQDRGLLPEPGAGGDPAGFLRRPGGRGAGGGAGRGTEAVNG